uniref:NADH-ubiquinone oxidoreductase chain 3 n=1 Tax=Limnoperna fortunei TaxID=356393 RepID=A0A0R7GSQ5_LIMFO|nr:NADH dehydrogenase subunit 3 [Limnoperna fortunei]AKP18679.1 NADH dehydrogenase subunit 3 [Limnoperna fortunei]
MIQIRKQANRDKLSPYECGFQPLMSARVSFSLRFYLVMIMFVIFDVEVVLMIPVLFVLYGAKDMWSSISVFLFILILILGVLYERRDGSMDWSMDSKSWTGQKM